MSQTNRKLRAIEKAKQEDQDRRVEATAEKIRQGGNKRDHRRNLKIFLIGALILFAVGGIKYLNDSSPADADAVAATKITTTDPTRTGVIVTDLGNGKLAFSPDAHSRDAHPDMVGTGFTFYPGGQVERDAYAVLAQKLAKKGFTVILEEVPFDLAVFDPNSAEGNRELLPEITNWYIGGHSLGGVVAANYLASHDEPFSGLIMLASYATDDISHLGLPVLCIHGDKDGVLSMEAHDENSEMLPEGVEEAIIKGGNHGQFGNYGKQRGDQDADISREEQQEQTVKLIYDFAMKHNK